MAGDTKVKIECKIQDIKEIPNTKKQIVSVHFKLGEREWFKGFRLEYDRPISMEEFQRELVRVGVFPVAEEDFLAYVKEEAGSPFTIEVDRADEKPTDTNTGQADN